MKQLIQNKIDRIKAMAAANPSIYSTVHEPSASVASDNLSKAIRNKRDAEIFQYELKAAISMARR